MTRIEIEVGNSVYVAELNDTETARALLAHLPLQTAANVWGEEIYFAVPVTMDEAPDAREEVPVGTLAYWPPGKAFCIFFGPTPVSQKGEPRAYSPVNIIGALQGDVAPLRRVRGGAAVQVRLAAGGSI